MSSKPPAPSAKPPQVLRAAKRKRGRSKAKKLVRAEAAAQAAQAAGATTGTTTGTGAGDTKTKTAAPAPAPAPDPLMAEVSKLESTIFLLQQRLAAIKARDRARNEGGGGGGRGGGGGGGGGGRGGGGGGGTGTGKPKSFVTYDELIELKNNWSRPAYAFECGVTKNDDADGKNGPWYIYYDLENKQTQKQQFWESLPPRLYRLRDTNQIRIGQSLGKPVLKHALRLRSTTVNVSLWNPKTQTPVVVTSAHETLPETENLYVDGPGGNGPIRCDIVGQQVNNANDTCTYLDGADADARVSLL